MTKRRLPADDDDYPPWWDRLSSEIHSFGDGYLSPTLRFATSSRELYVSEAMPKDHVIMRLPASSQVSLDRLRKHIPWLDELQGQCLQAIQSKSMEFYTPLADLCMAVGMAVCHQEQRDNRSLIYLETLPNSSEYNALPRRWSDDTLKCLTGSPLLERVRTMRTGVEKDYVAMQTLFQALSKTKDNPLACSLFPSFQTFSDMLAAVSSRAFDFSEHTGSNSSSGVDDIVILPILDLCDHARGSRLRKNLSYSRLENGTVEVRAVQPLKSKDRLCLTYGAQGNAPLLLNYGFTIPSNMEPDLSSNDVLDVDMAGRTVSLRTGPKSYTYGSFSTLVELAQQNDGAIQASYNPNEMDTDTDMNAFLDECEEDSEEVDIYSDQVDEKVTSNDGPTTEESTIIQAEIEAMDEVRKVLQQRLGNYRLCGDKLSEVLTSELPTAHYYSAVLVHSEQQILRFFICVAGKVRSLLHSRLSEHRDTEETKPDSLAEPFESQADELARVFMNLRHPTRTHVDKPR